MAPSSKSPTARPPSRTLVNLNGNANGANPTGVVLDSNGNLYTTTLFGGSGDGTLVKIATATDTVTVTSLTTFLTGGLSLDASGNLYSVASGNNVFEIPQGTTTINTLYTFTSGGNFGVLPQGNLVLDSVGDIFGVNRSDSSLNSDAGIVFEDCSRHACGLTSSQHHL